MPTISTGADLAPDTADAVAASIATHGARPDALIEILHDLSGRLRHVPEAALPAIAHALNLSRAEVHGTMSFYHDFHTSPPGGTVIRICVAEACKSMGADALFAAAKALPGVTIEPVYCLGNCALSPAAMVEGELVGRASLEMLRDAVAQRAGR